MGSLKIACQEISFPEELRMLHACTRRFAQQELMPLERLYANDPDIADDVRAALPKRYQDEPFVHVLKKGGLPKTQDVRGSNHVEIGVFADRIPGRVIIISTIDNLVKGSAGQAIQNFNLMFGLPETEGLMQVAMFP